MLIRWSGPWKDDVGDDDDRREDVVIGASDGVSGVSEDSAPRAEELGGSVRLRMASCHSDRTDGAVWALFLRGCDDEVNVTTRRCDRQREALSFCCSC
jgi:hypothetical protein